MVGLGNPGPQYENTRHNVGHRVISACAENAGVSFSSFKSHGVTASIKHPSGITLRLAVLSSFMNRSGAGVKALLSFYSIPSSQLIVVHDELDLDFGVVRIKSGGGNAGHNGLKDITTHLGNPDFLRIRVGIGRPPGRQDPADYVLSRFVANEEASLPEVLDRACRAAEAVAVSGLVHAQQVIHSESGPASAP